MLFQVKIKSIQQCCRLYHTIIQPYQSFFFVSHSTPIASLIRKLLLSTHFSIIENIAKFDHFQCIRMLLPLLLLSMSHAQTMRNFTKHTIASHHQHLHYHLGLLSKIDRRTYHVATHNKINKIVKLHYKQVNVRSFLRCLVFDSD